MSWTDSQVEVALRVIEQDHTPASLPRPDWPKHIGHPYEQRLQLEIAREEFAGNHLRADILRDTLALARKMRKGNGSGPNRPNLDQGDDNRE